MSETDVKLFANQVVVNALDLCLDGQSGRRSAPDPNPDPDPNTSYRRALVHDFDDGLTINWDNDYPGGVTINHLKTIDPTPKLSGTGPQRVIQAVTATVTIKGNAKIERNLTVDGDLNGKVLVNYKEAGGVELGLLKSKVTAENKATAVPLDQLLTDIFSSLTSAKAPQTGWRWCKKCEGLFFALHDHKGVCPAGGEHSEEGSSWYFVQHG
jgi:hypothetical protein